ncbi:MAG: hypothetical protein JO270_03460 [Acidobacteriaceae bacterium]|nr:hypothetical protein [Acidobacteriaceae bacterium]
MTIHPNPHRLSHRPDLVLHHVGSKCVCSPFAFNHISLELVLRGLKQDYAEMPNEISALHAELVLRDVPGELIQWWRQLQRFRRSILITAVLDSSPDKVVRILVSPAFLCLDPPRGLALVLPTSTLTPPHSRIGTEPPTTNTTRFLSGFSHGDSSSPPPLSKGGILVSFSLGHSCQSDAGRF